MKKALFTFLTMLFLYNPLFAAGDDDQKEPSTPKNGQVNPNDCPATPEKREKDQKRRRDNEQPPRCKKRLFGDDAPAPSASPPQHVNEQDENAAAEAADSLRRTLDAALAAILNQRIVQHGNRPCSAHLRNMCSRH